MLLLTAAHMIRDYKLSLEVINTNPKAEALYHRIGYVVVKRRPIWPLNGFIRFPFKAAIFMEKTIV
jgi:ribosomal protein S18 acetylase RimI-like enzyme